MRKFNSGDIVRIVSKASKYKGAIGTIQGYCNGRYKNICRVAISDKCTINIFDDGLTVLCNERDAVARICA